MADIHPTNKKSDDSRNHSPRILLVDDSESLRSALCEMIVNKLAVSVDLADSGHAAAQLLKTNQYRVVVSDMSMPDGDGAWLLSFMKAQKCESPLIIFSAELRPEIPALDNCLRAVVDKGEFAALISAIENVGRL